MSHGQPPPERTTGVAASQCFIFRGRCTELFSYARELGLLPEPEQVDPWLTTEGAAEYSGLSVGTIRNLVSEGRILRHGEKGHSLRFRQSELDAYLESRGRVCVSGTP